jgi:hypothetical protein
MNMNFERGKDPKETLGGIKKITKEKLEEKKVVKSKFDPVFDVTLPRDEKSINVRVSGKLVLRDRRELDRVEGIKVELSTEAGSEITILEELSAAEICSHIKEFYEDTIQNCRNKTLEEQTDYLYRNLNSSEYGVAPNPLKTGNEIQASAWIVRAIKSDPDRDQLSALCKNLKKELEYGLQAADDHGVQIRDYLEELEKRLRIS